MDEDSRARDRPTPQTQSHRHPSKLDRPDTPLDIFQTMHRKVCSSLDSDRVFETKHSPIPATSTAQAMVDPSVHLAQSPPRHRRLDTFREQTRAKLASFSGFQSHASDARIRSSSRPGLSSRVSSLAPPPPPPQQQQQKTKIASPKPKPAPVATTNRLAPEPVEIAAPSSPGWYAPSVTSTQSSGSRRDRVLGVQNADSVASSAGGGAGGAKVFVPQKRSDVLPFAADHPFAAWDPTAGASKSRRRPSVRLGQMEVREEEPAGGDWRVTPKGKRVWEGYTGVYSIGWERDILDLEARIHEALWDLDETHTFATFTAGEEPATVLDIGTGLGLWPISQALLWPESTFIGLDVVPVQTDLSVLARAERNARSCAEDTAPGQGIWESIERRISWDRGDFLKRLPYDAGVFDMVHIRLCGLGIPESQWGQVIEEAARVLRPGGTLEIVEMAYTLDDSTPLSIKNAFGSLLMADMIQPSAILPIRFHLPSSDLLVPLYKPVFEKRWLDATMSEAMVFWVKSALDGKGTGLKKSTSGKRALQALQREGKGWAVQDEVEDTLKEATVWAWVVKKQ